MKRHFAPCALALVLFASPTLAQEQSAPDNLPVASTEVIEVAPRLPSSTYRWYVPTARDQLMPLEQPRTIANGEGFRPYSLGVELGFMHFFESRSVPTASIAFRLDYAWQGLATVGASVGYLAGAGLVFTGVHVGVEYRITLWRASTWLDVQLLLPEARARVATGFDSGATMLFQVALLPIGVRLWGCNRFSVDVRLEMPSVGSLNYTQVEGLRNNRVSVFVAGWGSSITASLLL
jgi:hypothetical protein